MSKRELKKAETTKKSGDRKGGGAGSHGSITKAGKVRAQTPKIEKTNLKKRKGPRVNNRKEWLKSLTHPRKSDKDQK